MSMISDPTQPAHDARGHLIAYVFVDGADLGRALLPRGRAGVDLIAQAFARMSAYKAVETGARAAKRGIWSRCR